MTDVHPTLRKCAEAICDSAYRTTGPVATGGGTVGWEEWLPEARAVLTAFANSQPHLDDLADLIREIAAEPKPTVEDVLYGHRPGMPSGGGSRCLCDEHQWSFTHQADMLRAAGLIAGDE